VAESGGSREVQRPSPDLLELRRIERKTVLSKSYDEATAITRIADKRQRVEESAFAASLSDEMKRDFFRMKGQRADEVVRLNYDALDGKLAVQQQKEMQALELCVVEVRARKGAPGRALPGGRKRASVAEALLMKVSPRTAAGWKMFENDRRADSRIAGVPDRTFSELLAAHLIVRLVSEATQCAPLLWLLRRRAA